MPLTKLQFRPGVVRDQTAYTNEGGWRSSNLVRFRLGFPETIGGWMPYSNDSVLGSCRCLHTWVALDSSNYMGLGTNLKFYVEWGEQFYDITPIRSTVTLANPFTATNGSNQLLVTDTAHGCVVGDFVTISGSASLGGNVTAAILNTEHQISQVLDDNRYRITLPVTANASDTGKGGATVTFAYQVNVGLDTQVAGTGWGAGMWPDPDEYTLTNPFTTSSGSGTVTFTHNSHGLLSNEYVAFSGATAVGGLTAGMLNRTFQVTVTSPNTYTIPMGGSITASSSTTGGGTVTAYYQTGTRGWGTAATLSIGNTLRLWSEDNYGEDLLFNVRGGGIYYWDKSAGLTARGVALDSLSSDPTCPTVANQVMVSDRDRHTIVFGADYGDGIADPMNIRFSSQEDPYTWTPTATNTAGDLRLGSGSRIIKAIETKRSILIFTDTTLYSMQFIGPPYTFGVEQISSGVTIMGYNSAVAVDDAVFWMGIDCFYLYSGQTQQLVCPLKEFIFHNLNYGQSDKVFASLNTAFNEVTWFYPSENSEQNDRYVTYNYVEQAWTYGEMSRDSWIDRGVRQYPIASMGNGGSTSKLYNHEMGRSDGSLEPPGPINAYIESSPIDISEGDQFMLIRRIIPDVAIQAESNVQTPTITMTLKTQRFPGSNYNYTTNSGVVRSAQVPIEQYTEQAFVRLRGRQVSFRIESNQANVGWRLGSPRIDVRQDGRR